MIVRISSNLSELMSGMSANTKKTTSRKMLENLAELVEHKAHEWTIANDSQDLGMFNNQWNVTNEHHSDPAV